MAGARYNLTKIPKEPNIQGYWKNCQTSGVRNIPGGGTPTTGRLVFNYLETRVHSSQWALGAPRAGEF